MLTLDRFFAGRSTFQCGAGSEHTNTFHLVKHFGECVEGAYGEDLLATGHPDVLDVGLSVADSVVSRCIPVRVSGDEVAVGPRALRGRGAENEEFYAATVFGSERV